MKSPGWVVMGDVTTTSVHILILTRVAPEFNNMWDPFTVPQTRPIWCLSAVGCSWGGRGGAYQCLEPQYCIIVLLLLLHLLGWEGEGAA